MKRFYSNTKISSSRRASRLFCCSFAQRKLMFRIVIIQDDPSNSNINWIGWSWTQSTHTTVSSKLCTSYFSFRRILIRKKNLHFNLNCFLESVCAQRRGFTTNFFIMHTVEFIFYYHISKDFFPLNQPLLIALGGVSDYSKKFETGENTLWIYV